MDSDTFSVVDSGYGSSCSNFSTPTSGSGLTSARNSPCDNLGRDSQSSQFLYSEPNALQSFSWHSPTIAPLDAEDNLSRLLSYSGSSRTDALKLPVFPAAITIEKNYGDDGGISADYGNPFGDDGNSFGDNGNTLGDNGNTFGDNGNLFGDNGNIFHYDDNIFGDPRNMFMDLAQDSMSHSSDNQSAISTRGLNDGHTGQGVAVNSSHILSHDTSSVFCPMSCSINHSLSYPCHGDQEQGTSTSETSKSLEDATSRSCEQQMLPNAVEISNPARSQLRDIESKLDQLMSLVSGLECQSPIEDGSEGEEDGESLPFTLTTSNDSQDDSLSCSSAASPWILSIASCQTNGSGISTCTSDGSSTTSPDRSSGSQSSLPSSATKRTYSNDGSPQEDDPDDYRKKSPKRSPGDVSPESDGSSEKQIPCFVDDCPGKDKHVSEVMSVYPFFFSAFYSELCVPVAYG